MEVLGIDIGGSGIKGAPIDTKTGELLAERHRIETPEPSTPEAVGDVVAQLTAHFDWKGRVGYTFPAVIKGGVAHTAANVSDEWIGTNAEELFSGKTGCPAAVLNDADAAGIAEMRVGAGRGQMGVVFMLTVGTGIGTAIFINGQLFPNLELGHMEVRGKEAELRASDRTRRDKGLDWPAWGKRFSRILNAYEDLFWPDLFIIGGGASKPKRFAKFIDSIEARTPVVRAEFANNAGIVGAAMWAAEK